MAGVPAIFQAMVASLAPSLTGGDPLLSRTVIAQVPEGTVAADLGALQQQYPDVDMGSYPAFRGGKASTAMVLRATDRSRTYAANYANPAILRRFGGEHPEKDNE